MTITEFLLARIAEDEAAAKAATPGPWRTEVVKVGRFAEVEAHVFSTRASHILLSETDGKAGQAVIPNAEHIARHDPARVLAACAAKRALVGRYEKYYATRRANWMNPNYAGSMEELGWTLQTLAAVYADHPDYDPEWAL